VELDLNKPEKLHFTSQVPPFHLRTHDVNLINWC